MRFWRHDAVGARRHPERFGELLDSAFESTVLEVSAVAVAPPSVCPAQGFEDARAAIYSAETVQWQECRVHGCSCLVPHVDFDMSGLPCVDNSQMKQCNGARQFEEGPTGPLFCVWALRLRRYHIPLAVLENTPATRIAAIDCRTHILDKLLGDLYNVYPLRVEPADVGHSGVSRTRLYVIVVIKTARKLADPVQLFHSVADHVRTRFQTKPRDYLIAGDLEVQFEAFATASLPACKCAARVPFRSNVLDLSYLLTDREARAVQQLNQLYSMRTGQRPESNPDLCYFLGDDPSFTVNWSAVSNRVPVLRRNAGKLWFPAERRWMTSAEKLLILQARPREATCVCGCRVSLCAFRSVFAWLFGCLLHFGFPRGFVYSRI
ncbi:unnamed protein product [Symbiodinium sp. CCMP2456]|nr:unnamed protein product [Symbiodinium sp. CCMP2456]